ncbi:MAG: GIY-YIG nuclease family protein [Proteocatella sp.]
MENVKNYFVYILECSDKTLYTGYTVDIERRFLEHNQARGAKYTRGRLPVKIVYLEKHMSLSVALKREAEIKSKTKKQKLELINLSSVNGGISIEEIFSNRQ